MTVEKDPIDPAAGINLPPAKLRSLEDFANAVRDCQGVMFFGAKKLVSAPGKTEFMTGGYKNEGVTPADLANGLGVLVAELARNICDMGQVLNRPTSFEQAIKTVMAYVEASARKAPDHTKFSRHTEGSGNGSGSKDVPDVGKTPLGL